MRRYLSLLIIAMFLVGCHTPTIANPNDPAQVGVLSGENIVDQLESASDGLALHRDKREISEMQYEAIMAQYARQLLVGFSSGKAFKYGKALITAQMWPEAKQVLEVAVNEAKLAHNEDRRINDTIRLARVLAELDDAKGAIETARTVFDAKPRDSAPILLGVLYDIVPRARLRGVDVELAKLIEDAIQINMRVLVDPSTKEGALFLNARPRHVHIAWETVISLYTDANRPDLASEATKKAEAMSHGAQIEPTAHI